MKINIASWDRILRFGLGIAGTAWATAGGPFWAWLALYFLVTASWGLCPIYVFLKPTNQKKFSNKKMSNQSTNSNHPVNSKQLSQNQINELLIFLREDQINLDKKQCDYFGKDWTTYYDINCAGVLFPESTEEVSKIVKWARACKIAIVPSGGRTGLSGGACATKGEVVISLNKMSKVIEYNEIDKTVTVEAGFVTEALQKFADEKNLFYPVDFAAKGSSQIGGNIATNAGGIKVLRYGMTREWILGLTAVTGTGEVLRLNRGLIKNATGYDFRNLFIGSEGTLGVITEATIRLAPKPSPFQVALIAVENLPNLMEVFGHYSKMCRLTAFEMFSELALKKVLSHTKLTNPFSNNYPFYAVLEYENSGAEAGAAAMAAFEFCLEKGLVLDGTIAANTEQEKTFWRYRENISESLAVFSPYKNDISVRVSRVPEFVKDLDLILSGKYPTWEVVWFGHIGDGNLHINILRPPNTSKEDFVKECQKVDTLVFDVVKKYQGAISAEHGVGLSKKMFLNFTRSESEIALMKEIKKAFDPDNIMNPGKVI